MSQISSVLKLHYRDRWSWIYIPAIILFSSFAVNLIISFLVPETIKTGGIMSIFIYIFVTGIVVVAKTFPFALGMSIRRIDYFIGSAMMGMISSAFFTSLLFLFVLLEKSTNGWGSNLHFFYLPYVNDGTLLEQVTLYLIFFLHLYFLGYWIAIFAQRFGGKGMFISSMVLLLLGSVTSLFLSYLEAWGTIFSWFAGHTAIQIAYWLAPFILLYLFGSYCLMRRAVI